MSGSSTHHHHEHDHHHAHHESSHAGHDHAGHGHHHAPENFDRAFVIALVLNVGIVVLETVFGILSNSVALLADAGHNLADVLGLVVAFAASIAARRASSARLTYGLKASSIWAALFNAIFILVVIGGLSWEAIGRFFHPEPVAGGTVAIVSAIGMVLNGATALLFLKGHADDLNIRGAFLHMVGDAAVSASVLVAGVLIAVTGWLWLDPLVSLAVNVAIVWGTWGLLRDSVQMAMQGVPRAIDPDKVRTFLATRPGVGDLHDLHIWSMSTRETALTAHLVMPDGAPDDAFLREISETLRDTYRIGHVTLQVERSREAGCALALAACA